MQLGEFSYIEVTAISDRRTALIRTDLIEAILDNAEEKTGGYVRLACRTIKFAGTSLDVVESLEEIKELLKCSDI